MACCPQGAEAVCVIAGDNGESGDRNQLGRPTAVALGPDGALIVADGENHCIMCLSQGAGQGTVFAGGNGAGAGAATVTCMVAWAIRSARIRVAAAGARGPAVAERPAGLLRHLFGA